MAENGSDLTPLVVLGLPGGLLAELAGSAGAVPPLGAVAQGALMHVSGVPRPRYRPAQACAGAPRRPGEQKGAAPRLPPQAFPSLYLVTRAAVAVVK